MSQRFISQFRLRPFEWWCIQHAMNRRMPQIRIPIVGHGLVQIVPVRIQSISDSRLRTDFLWNPYPFLDMDVLSHITFPYSICSNDSVRSHTLKPFTTRLDQFIVGPIHAPDNIQRGDILLASRIRPELR